MKYLNKCNLSDDETFVIVNGKHFPTIVEKRLLNQGGFRKNMGRLETLVEYELQLQQRKYIIKKMETGN